VIALVVQTLSIALLIGALLHGYGSVLAYKPGTPELVWSLGSSSFVILLSALGWISASSTEHALPVVTAAGALAWSALVLFYGRAIRNILDPRVLYHLVVAIALAGSVMMP
jgi:hypothetical protein